jgi:LacI family transcriptional regulator
MSVLGFDNSAISTLLDPPLQTIGISSQHMAKMAMDILAAKIDHVDTYLSSSLIFPQMVERSSTGVPKK